MMTYDADTQEVIAICDENIAALKVLRNIALDDPETYKNGIEYQKEINQYKLIRKVVTRTPPPPSGDAVRFALDVLDEAADEYWDDHHSHMSEGDFEYHWLIVKIREAQKKLRAALSAPVDTGWMPIETAPKVTDILLGFFNDLGNWRTVRGAWLYEVCDYNEEPLEDGEGWYEVSVMADDLPNVWRVEPTHWRPLPAPPVKQKLDGRGA